MNTDIYKQKLEEEKVLLESELSRLGHFDAKSGDWDATPESQTLPEADENDKADRAEGYEERTAILNTLEVRYNDVILALKKIEEGTYGTCEVSGEPIEEDRLDANPAARTSKAHMQ
jgi:DnaK suppressor protein